MSELRRRGSVRSAIVLCALGAVIAGAIAATRKDTSELDVYITAAQRMLAGTEIYSPSDPKPFTYPPFFAILFVPLAVLPAATHRLLWFSINVALLAFVVVTLRRIVRDAAPIGFPRIGWLLVAALGMRHVFAVFENQSHDLIVCAWFAAGALAAARHRESRSGSRFGLAAAAKATPLLMLPVMLGQGRLRAAAVFVLAASLVTLTPDVLMPRSDGRLHVVAWFQTFAPAIRAAAAPEVGNAWTPHNFLNQNLIGLVRRWTDHPLAEGTFVRDVAFVQLPVSLRRAIKLVLQLAVVASIAIVARPRRRNQEPTRVRSWRRFGECGLVACGMLLLSPMSSKSHFCLLVLPILFCVETWLRTRDRRVLAALLVAFVAGTLTSKGIVGSRVGNLLLAHGAVTWTTLALMVGSAIGLSPSLLAHSRDAAWVGDDARLQPTIG
jgi:hypothetical protein